MAISAASKQGLKELLYELKSQVVSAREAEVAKEVDQDEGVPIYRLEPEHLPWRLIKRDDGYLVRGKKIERFAIRTDFTNEEGVRRLRDIMKKMGIMKEIEKQGVNKGDIIQIASVGQIEY